jgi:hypothetical protein
MGVFLKSQKDGIIISLSAHNKRTCGLDCYFDYSYDPMEINLVPSGFNSVFMMNNNGCMTLNDDTLTNDWSEVPFTLLNDYILGQRYMISQLDLRIKIEPNPEFHILKQVIHNKVHCELCSCLVIQLGFIRFCSMCQSIDNGLNHVIRIGKGSFSFNHNIMPGTIMNLIREYLSLSIFFYELLSILDRKILPLVFYSEINTYNIIQILNDSGIDYIIGVLDKSQFIKYKITGKKDCYLFLYDDKGDRIDSFNPNVVLTNFPKIKILDIT